MIYLTGSKFKTVSGVMLLNNCEWEEKVYERPVVRRAPEAFYRAGSGGTLPVWDQG